MIEILGACSAPNRSDCAKGEQTAPHPLQQPQLQRCASASIFLCHKKANDRPPLNRALEIGVIGYQHCQKGGSGVGLTRNGGLSRSKDDCAALFIGAYSRGPLTSSGVAPFHPAAVRRYSWRSSKKPRQCCRGFDRRWRTSGQWRSSPTYMHFLKELQTS